MFLYYYSFMAYKEISSIRTVISKLTPKNLADIMKKYDIDPEFYPRFPEPRNVIVDDHEDFVSVYQVFFKSCIQFLVFKILKTVLDYYGRQIAQITMNRVQKIIYFVMLCSTLDIVPSITVFHHFI